MKDVRNKKILIAGLGSRSGLSAANFLAEKGALVTVSDLKSADELSGIIEKLAPGIKVLAGDQSPSVLDRGFDLIVLSPGVPADVPLIREARTRSVKVISEIELAFYFIRGDIIAVTGTDGKSTVVTLVNRILKGLGYESLIGGNIGIPAISIADRTTGLEAIVLELSSYQLETIEKFRPAVACILNITPDHLDRYTDMGAYRDAKFRIAMNQNPDDVFVYNADDALITERINRVKSRKTCFSLSDEKTDIYFKDDIICFPEGVPVMRAGDMIIRGRHNIQNAMASVLITRAFVELRGDKFDAKKTADIISSFEGLEHRMRVVGVFRDRTFINDSKATTVNAVEMALSGFDGNAVLIMGGRSKGDDYSRIVPALRKGVRAIVLIGETRYEFSEMLREFSPAVADSLDEAVFKAMELSRPGDYVILSPACASFDMFSDYEERGDAFAASFKKLAGGVKV